MLSFLFYFIHIFRALFEILRYLFQSIILRRPVSYPGDPIKNPQSRRGKWPSKDYYISNNWRYAVDKESHTISEQQTPKYKLTGESAGRQMWHYDENMKNSSVIVYENEKVVFNANNNPNSSDKLMRNYLIGKWQGSRPDVTIIPKTAKVV